MREYVRVGKPLSYLKVLAAIAFFMPALHAQADGQAAAFLQPDPVTKKLPYQAIKLTRGQTVLSSDSPIQACDRLEFLASQAEVKQVRVTTYIGGRNIILDKANAKTQIACQKPSLSRAMGDIWIAISGGDRASYVNPATSKASAAAATRNQGFAFPIFSSDRSQIVAGRRALIVPWVGGVSPYKMILKRASSGEVLAEVKVESGHTVRLPEIDLSEGQYSLTVMNTPTDGSQPGLQEENLYVVDALKLPPVPDLLNNAKLASADLKLLYVFYLEGYGDGRWAFEAFQLAAEIPKPTAAVKYWLQTYTSSR